MERRPATEVVKNSSETATNGQDVQCLEMGGELMPILQLFDMFAGGHCQYSIISENQSPSAAFTELDAATFPMESVMDAESSTTDRSCREKDRVYDHFLDAHPSSRDQSSDTSRRLVPPSLQESGFAQPLGSALGPGG